MSDYERWWELNAGGLYEHRRRWDGVVKCPRCGDRVLLFSETEAWERANRRWEHAYYGPSEGVCCGLLIVDTYYGCSSYELGAP